MTWTDARVETLRTLVTERLSAGQIGDRLGTTRNAIIGKCKRLGLALPNATPGIRKAHKPYPLRRRAVPTTARPQSARPTLPPLPTEPIPEPVEYDRERLAESVTLLDLEPQHCRWPLSAHDMANHRFCGCQRLDGFPYCETHARRAFAPVAPKRLTYHETSHDATISRAKQLVTA